MILSTIVNFLVYGFLPGLSVTVLGLVHFVVLLEFIIVDPGSDRYYLF